MNAAQALSESQYKQPIAQIAVPDIAANDEYVEFSLSPDDNQAVRDDFFRATCGVSWD